jgi:Putative capsular polysaccharide synthesis protein
MKTNPDIICIPWTTLLWHRRNFILAFFLSWITKPCTGMIHKYKLRKALSRSKKVYLVLQPGKVASKAIVSFLKVAGASELILHLHYISETKAALEQHGPTGRDLLFPQISNFDFLTQSLNIFAMNGGEVIIICGIRDPWSRSRSAFLQNLDSILLYDSRYTFFQSPINISLSRYELSDQLNKFNFEFQITWFDKVLLPLSGIDVYQYQFPIEEGCLWISKSQFHIFLYRFDRIQNSKIAETMSYFLGLSPEITKIPTLNETSPERLQLKALVKSFQIPESVSAYFASSKLSKHFFTAEEIARFITNK